MHHNLYTVWFATLVTVTNQPHIAAVFRYRQGTLCCHQYLLQIY
ncbi:hypothetical protein YPPY89_1988 [Yersinia pestis PY-89]|nr:hypothetical protein YPPY89_1988 [Yersinia pestis PY-89]